MSVQGTRLVMGILFLVLGLLILARRWVMPDLDAKFDSMRMNLGAVLALALGGLNIARWYAMWSYQRSRQTPVQTPLQPDPTRRGTEPPNPDFDFTKGNEAK